MTDVLSLRATEEHLLSRLEVEIERGLQAANDQDYGERLMAYCAAGQHLVETIQAAIEVGGEPMRAYLQQRYEPVLERMQAVITQLTTEMEDNDG